VRHRAGGQEEGIGHIPDHVGDIDGTFTTVNFQSGNIQYATSPTIADHINLVP
jgi:hypothetical protein